ncbi:Mitogen-activated protein [Vigna angularis]|uniref:Mitogen-activated protein n=1 Tax=Phaseolus angularis TaxID=3914 RepID=A0A8T0K471_PHAAN|nr:Mitogen-activated protein [Vigna angularis]
MEETDIALRWEGEKETYVELSATDEDEDEEEKEEEDEEEGDVGGVKVEREEEENAERIVDIVDEFYGFSTSNEDDSFSTTTGPNSSNISPNGRIKHVITAGNWQKGELLGRGLFGYVYEGISKILCNGMLVLELGDWQVSCRRFGYENMLEKHMTIRKWNEP